MLCCLFWISTKKKQKKTHLKNMQHQIWYPNLQNYTTTKNLSYSFTFSFYSKIPRLYTVWSRISVVNTRFFGNKIFLYIRTQIFWNGLLILNRNTFIKSTFPQTPLQNRSILLWKWAGDFFLKISFLWILILQTDERFMMSNLLLTS